MGKGHSDRNLLIGLLALQMDFIDQTKLIGAMQAWVLEKSTSLSEILRKRGDLTDDTFALLEALVNKHLELHKGDPERSLASLTDVGSVRDKLNHLNDEDVRASLVHCAPQDPQIQPTIQCAVPQATGGRFQIVRFHDRGGIGDVFVATDNELHRKVALKEIQSQHAFNAESRARFMLEAEVTGGLEHPGIVPVYGLGHYSDGRPFYAMRFIRGDNLQGAIEQFHSTDFSTDKAGQRNLAVRQLLGRLIDVCNAIEYAHRRGVLHRDLKPGNIMLGKYGETLVVDWGLAKVETESRHSSTDPEESILEAPSASASAPTLQGRTLGTPCYMSPEQAAGRLDELGPASDIFSLGATLYQLLTGQPPYPGKTVGAVLEQAMRVEFKRPREVKKDVPPALDAICVKAMARNPLERYESAAALAADLERWLADEPVSVYRETVSERITRWMRRHKTWVSGAAAAACVAFVSLTSLFLIERHLRSEAERQRLRAEANLEVAKTAVDTMLTEVGKETLAEVPQMEEIRRELLEKARLFYERFREQKPTDKDLRLETALASLRVGDIYRLVSQPESAQQAYTVAIEELGELIEEDPHDPRYRQQLANAHNWFGVLSKKHTDTESATKHYETARRLQQELVEAFPEQLAYKQELARSCYNLGIVFSETKEFDEAKNAYQQAIDYLKAIVQAKGPPVLVNPSAQELARAYNDLAKLLSDYKPQQRSEAKEFYRRAIATLEGLIEKGFARREVLTELAVYYNNLSNAHLADMQNALSTQQPSGTEAGTKALEEAGHAEEANRQSLQHFETLTAGIPALENERANSHNSCGTILLLKAFLLQSRQGASAADDGITALRTDALAHFKQASQAAASLVKRFPTRGDFRDRAGTAIFNQGNLTDDAQQAIRLVREAIEHHEAALKTNPRNPEYLTHRMNDYVVLGNLHLKLGRHDEAFHAGETIYEYLSADPGAHRDALAQRLSMLFLGCASAARNDAQLSDMERKQAIDRYCGRLVELLRMLLKSGAVTVTDLEKAAQEGQPFAELNERQDFRDLLRSRDLPIRTTREKIEAPRKTGVGPRTSR